MRRNITRGITDKKNKSDDNKGYKDYNWEYFYGKLYGDKRTKGKNDSNNDNSN